MPPLPDHNSGSSYKTCSDKASTPPEGWLVRSATPTDAAAIVDIYNHHVDLGGSTFDASHWTEQQLKSLLAGSDAEAWLVAQQEHRIRGWASARWYSLRHGYRWTMETAIYLEPGAIGKGIANALQQCLEQHCREHRIHHLVAKIIANNQRSMAFHYRHGYELVGIQKEIGHMQGNWQDVAILQKLLPESG